MCTCIHVCRYIQIQYHIFIPIPYQSPKKIIPLQLQDLQQESEHLNDAAPSYLSSGQQAAARAEWSENPQALPPMAVHLVMGCRGDVGNDIWESVGKFMGIIGINDL